MELSDLGKRLGGKSGIDQIQEDLGHAFDGGEPLAMFGSGNPAHIPEVTQIYRQGLAEILAHPNLAEAMLGNYDTPRGNEAFIASVAGFMNRHYHLGISAQNIAITPGSQAGYFVLFNLLAGKSGHSRKKILFPVIPEYVGYSDQALEPGSFVGTKPKIRKIADHEFEYLVDTGHLPLDEDIAGICLSRPTNPSGNLVSDDELQHLGNIAVERNIPLLIDSAYGLPFPGIINSPAELFWNDQTVISLSLSKLGLPSSRVGIFIGPAPLMRALSRANAVANLASPSVGQYMLGPLLDNDEILKLSENHIKQYYFERSHKMRELINRHFPGNLPWRLHEYQGSFFLWLWLEGANKSSREVYDYLKKRGVIVASGDYFFFGLGQADWQHAHECLRLNFARPDRELEAGVPVLAEAVAWAYN